MSDEEQWLLDTVERTRKLNGEKSVVDGLIAVAKKIASLQSVVDAVARCYDEWDDGAEYHRVKIPNELWEQIRALDGAP